MYANKSAPETDEQNTNISVNTVIINVVKNCKLRVVKD